MPIKETAKFFHIQSPYIALALHKHRPWIGYLSLESGGRKRGHLDTNLLRPGLGGTLFPSILHHDSTAAHTSPCTPAHLADNTITYDHIPTPSGPCSCRIELTDDRTITLRFQSSQNTPLPTQLLQLAFAPDKSPMSLWAKPLDWNHPQQKSDWNILKPSDCQVDFHLPALASFPDYGLLRLDAPHAKITERMVADPANSGLNLGFSNYNNHNVRTAFHHGHFDLCIELTQPSSQASIQLHIAPELYPNLPDCDLSDPRFAPLRRLWMNSFTLNPPTLTMGDNPILAGTAHLSIHWKSQMAALTPNLLPDLKLLDFVRHTLERTFQQHTDEHGKMHGYGWENGGCNLISLCAYLHATNDTPFLLQHLPTITRVINYNLSLDTDADGLLEASYHGNHSGDPKTSLNWWDDFAFGHKDAYGNLIYYQAFRHLLPLLESIRATDLAAKLHTHLTRFRASFHKTFFNPATGVYAGWISQDGRMHDYMFTFITAMAINQGLVEQPLAQQMLQRLLDELEQNGYGDFRYGVPGPARPVDLSDRGNWAPMSDWGQYENGGFCGLTAYHFILALYRANMRPQADRILFNMLETFDSLPTHSGLNPGFTRSVDWRNKHGQPCGYNYLADNYVFLLAAIEGHFGHSALPPAAP